LYFIGIKIAYNGDMEYRITQLGLNKQLSSSETVFDRFGQSCIPNSGGLFFRKAGDKNEGG